MEDYIQIKSTVKEIRGCKLAGDRELYAEEKSVQQKIARTSTIQMLPLPNTKNKNQDGVESIGGRVLGPGDGQGRRGAEQSGMDLGSSRVSHIHTLRVETGH